MSATVVGVNDPKAVKRFSAFLAVDCGRKSYFGKKFTGNGAEAQTPLQRLSHLENDAGDQISYDLVAQLKMKPVTGDKTLRGGEEDLKFYTDTIYIDQLRGGVNTGGKMTRKRTIHDMRKIARARQSDWWARLIDETIFMYLSGGRGLNAEFIEAPGFAGYAGNAFVAPDDKHVLYANDATSDATIDSGDIMSLALIDRAVARADVMGGGTTKIPSMQPCTIDGEEHYVLVMHSWQEHSLRAASGSTWLDIQKAAAGAEGRNNPMFKGGLGMYNNVILHKHKGAIAFNGTNGISSATDATINVGRALFMGRQAGVIAYGSPGNDQHYDWNEEMEDRGNQIVITTGTTVGVKKTAFTIDGTSRDFGVIALDTYVADPS